MDAIRYLTVADTIALYEEAMSQSGQVSAPLVREGDLQRALHHPRNLGYYQGATLAEQAVDLAIELTPLELTPLQLKPVLSPELAGIMNEIREDSIPVMQYLKYK